MPMDGGILVELILDANHRFLAFTEAEEWSRDGTVDRGGGGGTAIKTHTRVGNRQIRHPCATDHVCLEWDRATANAVHVTAVHVTAVHVVRGQRTNAG